jgi:hypothetical protein
VLAAYGSVTALADALRRAAAAHGRHEKEIGRPADRSVPAAAGSLRGPAVPPWPWAGSRAAGGVLRNLG